MLDLKDLYQQRVSNCASNFIKVVLNPLELQFVMQTAAAIVDSKQYEVSHKKDGASEMKRFVNGLKGEAAVQKHLGIPIINPDVGVSIDFDTPDIPGYNVGIKTVEYGHFPVIPKINNYPQIICICHPTANEVVYICGLANETVLQAYQHDDLIVDPALRRKGTKTGFYGFSELKPVTIDLLNMYKQEEPKDETP